VDSHWFECHIFGIEMMKIDRKLLFVALILALLFALTFSVGKEAIHVDRRADTALFIQVLENIRLGRGAVSNVFASTQNFIDRVYFDKSLPQLLGMDLIRPENSERGMMRFHLYLILYLVSPLLALVQASALLIFLQTAAYIGAFCVVLWTLQKDLKSFGLALVFSLCVLIHPVVYGGLSGQFYPDRLFVLAGLILCCSIYRGWKVWSVIACASMAAILNERAALMAGLVMMFLPFCLAEEREGRRRAYIISVAGLGFVIYSYLIGKLWISNSYYGRYFPADFEEVLKRLRDHMFVLNSWRFLLVNSVLLAFALVNLRLGLFALLMIAPNLIGDVGGAEKVGWVTHYHSYYFPLLTFAAAMGFRSVMIGAALKIRLMVCALALLASVGVVALEISGGRLSNIAQSMMPFHALVDRIKGAPTGRDIRESVQKMVPKGALVVTDELGMALLSDHAKVDFFPVSAGQADYLFLPCDATSVGEVPVNKDVPEAWLTSKGFSARPTQWVSAVQHCLYARPHR
jgi:uncharacterized membrane protein